MKNILAAGTGYEFLRVAALDNETAAAEDKTEIREAYIINEAINAQTRPVIQ
jgi:hypothetical protein